MQISNDQGIALTGLDTYAVYPKAKSVCKTQLKQLHIIGAFIHVKTPSELFCCSPCFE